MAPALPYRSILLKLSGEALAGPKGYGLDRKVLKVLAGEIRETARSGVAIALVPGGGNIFRGMAQYAQGMDRVAADAMGMLATVINALAFHDALNKTGQDSVVMTAFPVGSFTSLYQVEKARAFLKEGRVLILAGGTGNPFFSTDTAAAIRARELEAGALFKATRVKGVYDQDPEKVPKARFLPRLTYEEVLKKDLKVMDATAVSLARESGLPILVFPLLPPGNLKKVLNGDPIGSWIGGNDA
jgi:uridylate kinase